MDNKENKRNWNEVEEEEIDDLERPKPKQRQKTDVDEPIKWLFGNFDVFKEMDAERELKRQQERKEKQEQKQKQKQKQEEGEDEEEEMDDLERPKPKPKPKPPVNETTAESLDNLGSGESQSQNRDPYPGPEMYDEDGYWIGEGEDPMPDFCEKDDDGFPGHGTTGDGYIHCEFCTVFHHNRQRKCEDFVKIVLPRAREEELELERIRYEEERGYESSDNGWAQEQASHFESSEYEDESYLEQKREEEEKELLAQTVYYSDFIAESELDGGKAATDWLKRQVESSRGSVVRYSSTNVDKALEQLDKKINQNVWEIEATKVQIEGLPIEHKKEYERRMASIEKQRQKREEENEAEKAEMERLDKGSKEYQAKKKSIREKNNRGLKKEESRIQELLRWHKEEYEDKEKKIERLHRGIKRHEFMKTVIDAERDRTKQNRFCNRLAVVNQKTEDRVEQTRRWRAHQEEILRRIKQEEEKLRERVERWKRGDDLKQVGAGLQPQDGGKTKNREGLVFDYIDKKLVEGDMDMDTYHDLKRHREVIRTYTVIAVTASYLASVAVIRRLENEEEPPDLNLHFFGACCAVVKEFMEVETEGDSPPQMHWRYREIAEEFQLFEVMNDLAPSSKTVSSSQTRGRIGVQYEYIRESIEKRMQVEMMKMAKKYNDGKDQTILRENLFLYLKRTERINNLQTEVLVQAITDTSNDKDGVPKAVQFSDDTIPACLRSFGTGPLNQLIQKEHKRYFTATEVKKPGLVAKRKEIEEVKKFNASLERRILKYRYELMKAIEDDFMIQWDRSAARVQHGARNILENEYYQFSLLPEMTCRMQIVDFTEDGSVVYVMESGKKVYKPARLGECFSIPGTGSKSFTIGERFQSDGTTARFFIQRKTAFPDIMKGPPAIEIQKIPDDIWGLKNRFVWEPVTKKIKRSALDMLGASVVLVPGEECFEFDFLEDTSEVNKRTEIDKTEDKVEKMSAKRSKKNELVVSANPVDITSRQISLRRAREIDVTRAARRKITGLIAHIKQMDKIWGLKSSN